MSKGRAGAAIRQLEGLFRGGTAAGLTDRQLLQRFHARGDESAFAALVERHGPMVLGVCRRVVRDRHDAEDAFQAAFLVLVKKAGSVRVDDSLGRWLYTVARRIALRAGASRRAGAAVELAEGLPSADGGDPAERREAWSALHEELGRLPEPYRAAVVLCHLEGLTHDEAARRLGWPIGTVKGRLSRARGLLRARLARRGLGLSAGALAATLRPTAVSAALVDRTVSAAIGFAAGRAATAGTVPAALLAKGVLGAMLMGKIKLSALIVTAFGVGLGVAGSGLVRLPEGPGRVARADDTMPATRQESTSLVKGDRVAERPSRGGNPEEDDQVLEYQVRAYEKERQAREVAYERARSDDEEAEEVSRRQGKPLDERDRVKRRFRLRLLRANLRDVEESKARAEASHRNLSARTGNQDPFRPNKVYADIVGSVDAPTGKFADPPAIKGSDRSTPALGEDELLLRTRIHFDEKERREKQVIYYQTRYAVLNDEEQSWLGVKPSNEGDVTRRRVQLRYLAERVQELGRSRARAQEDLRDLMTRLGRPVLETRPNSADPSNVDKTFAAGPANTSAVAEGVTPIPDLEKSERNLRNRIDQLEDLRRQRRIAYDRARSGVTKAEEQADLDHRRRLGEVEELRRGLDPLESELRRVEAIEARDQAALRDVQARLGRPAPKQEPFRVNNAFVDFIFKSLAARPANPPAIEGQKRAMPEYIVEPPDVILIEVPKAPTGRAISGERLVRPDGRINLGPYGEVYVAGLTVAQVKEKVTVHLRQSLTDADLGLVKGDGTRVEPKDTVAVSVDVAAYKSKVYYVQGDVGSPGRLPITGNETVLDAINLAGGLLPTAARKNIRLIRPAPPGACCEQVLPVNLDAIVQKGDATTNYQLNPGDRLVVYRDPQAAGPTDEARRKEIEGRIDAIIRELEGLRGELKK